MNKKGIEKEASQTDQPPLPKSTVRQTNVFCLSDGLTDWRFIWCIQWLQQTTALPSHYLRQQYAYNNENVEREGEREGEKKLKNEEKSVKFLQKKKLMKRYELKIPKQRHCAAAPAVVVVVIVGDGK